MRLQDAGPFAGHSPQQERPLGSYAVLMGLFGGLSGGFAVWLRRSGRDVPARIDGVDFALIAVAAHKSSRLLAKDRVTSILRAPFTTFEDDAGPGEVDEAARGRGLRRAIGELLICPYCIGLWVSGAMHVGLIYAPRTTRTVASTFTALTIADFLQIAYKAAEEKGLGGQS